MLDRPDWKALTKDERLAMLEPHRLAGESAAEMAAHFNNCTRNSVIGAFNRAGVAFGVSTHSKRQQTVAASRATGGNGSAGKYRGVVNAARKARDKTGAGLAFKISRARK